MSKGFPGRAVYTPGKERIFGADAVARFSFKAMIPERISRADNVSVDAQKNHTVSFRQADEGRRVLQAMCLIRQWKIFSDNG